MDWLVILGLILTALLGVPAAIGVGLWLMLRFEAWLDKDDDYDPDFRSK